MTYPIDPLNPTYSPYVGYIGGPRGTTYNITNAARTAGGVVTLTIGAHDKVIGDRAVVSGLGAPFTSLNGTFVITAVGATTISYASTASLIASASTTGTAIIGPRLDVNELDNLYVSNDGLAYRHFKDNARTRFWD